MGLLLEILLGIGDTVDSVLLFFTIAILKTTNPSPMKNRLISCDTEGATIRYTLDGSEPTTASTQFTTAINVSSTTTIKA
ncbi:MAG: chitobiase/beta-hexosaminidase C-terminal domain-containing protein, partial [Streptococcaceae bacterium]|nr:chitobiase/beta-hexosaminidase C-terminal domain-containing protein [Streptococcaceae bacterium]